MINCACLKIQRQREAGRSHQWRCVALSTRTRDQSNAPCLFFVLRLFSLAPLTHRGKMPRDFCCPHPMQCNVLHGQCGTWWCFHGSHHRRKHFGWCLHLLFSGGLPWARSVKSSVINSGEHALPVYWVCCVMGSQPELPAVPPPQHPADTHTHSRGSLMASLCADNLYCAARGHAGKACGDRGLNTKSGTKI